MHSLSAHFTLVNMNKPTEEEIQEMRDKAADAAAKPPKYPGMTFAEGIRDALEWVLGDAEEELDF